MQRGITFFEKAKANTGRLFTAYNRNLLVELIRANFKVRDHNSILGVSWSLLGPAAMLMVMYFVFRTRFGQGIRAYPLYLLVGIVFINFFITVTTYLTRIIFANREVVLNSTIPRESLILSNGFIHLYKFLIELGLCLALSIFYGLFTWKGILLLLPLLIAYIGFALGVGLIMSLIYCYARDIQHIWGLLSRLLYFATPVFYTLNSLSPLTRKAVYYGNPLTPFLLSFRGVFMGDVSPATYGHSLLLGAVFFALGYIVFIRFENMAVERA
jgi:ABC-type polysaccharide/polyol phosphate export permease